MPRSGFARFLLSHSPGHWALANSSPLKRSSITISALLGAALFFTVPAQAQTPGMIRRFAGVYGQPGFSGDGGPASSAQISGVTSLVSDSHGNVCIADYANFRIRRVDAVTGHHLQDRSHRQKNRRPQFHWWNFTGGIMDTLRTRA